MRRFYPGISGRKRGFKNFTIGKLQNILWTKINSLLRRKEEPFSYTAVGKIVRGTRGLLMVSNDPERVVEFQFNPQEIMDNKKVSWFEREVTGKDDIDLLWISGGARKVNFTLYFASVPSAFTPHFGHNTEVSSNTAARTSAPPEHDLGVDVWVETLKSFERPNIPDSAFSQGSFRPPLKMFVSPPLLTFIYGRYRMGCKLTALSTKYTGWDKALTPIYAECEVQLTIVESFVVPTDTTKLLSND